MLEVDKCYGIKYSRVEELGVQAADSGLILCQKRAHSEGIV